MAYGLPIFLYEMKRYRQVSNSQYKLKFSYGAKMKQTYREVAWLNLPNVKKKMFISITFASQLY